MFWLGPDVESFDLPSIFQPKGYHLVQLFSRIKQLLLNHLPIGLEIRHDIVHLC